MTTWFNKDDENFIDWITLKTSKGLIYYYNTKTEETSFEQPDELKTSEEKAMDRSTDCIAAMCAVEEPETRSTDCIAAMCTVEEPETKIRADVRSQFSNRAPFAEQFLQYFATKDPDDGFPDQKDEDFFGAESDWRTLPTGENKDTYLQLSLNPVIDNGNGFVKGTLKISEGTEYTNFFGVVEPFKDLEKPAAISFSVVWHTGDDKDERAVTTWTGSVFLLEFEGKSYQVMATTWTRVDSPDDKEGLRSATTNGTDFWRREATSG